MSDKTKALCSCRSSWESESIAKVEVNERHISEEMGIVSGVHCAGEVNGGWMTAARVSEAGLLDEM